MTVAQILAVVIFVAMFGLIVSEKIERHLVSWVRPFDARPGFRPEHAQPAGNLESHWR